MKLPRTKNILLFLILYTVFIAQLPAYADTLCYKTNPRKSVKKNVLQVFKNSCPRGFTLLSVEALDVKKLITQGVEGNQGPKGLTGAQGINGPKGDTGIAGDAGARGPLGSQGMIGLQGDSGPKGATGNSGEAGFSASELFFFTGGTGDTLLGTQGDLQIYPLNQSGGPTTGSVNTSDLMIPVGSSCSAVVFIATLDVAPGAGQFWQFKLLSGNYSSAPTLIPLCSMTASAKNCSFTLKLPFALNSENSIALLADKLSTSPPSTTAHWSLRCTAS